MDGVSLLKCKWALSILVLLHRGEMRPSELRRAIKGISERVLFDRLSKMVEAGIAGRWTNSGYPKESYYYLKDPQEFGCLVEWIESSSIPPEQVAELFSCKWTMGVLKSLKEPASPSSLKEQLPGISDKVLQQRLRKLEELGLVKRSVLPDRPIRVRYSLSDKGSKLLPLLIKMEGVILGSESYLVHTENT